MKPESIALALLQRLTRRSQSVQEALYKVASCKSTEAVQFKICMGRLCNDKTKAAGAAYKASLCIYSITDIDSENGFACLDTTVLSSVNHSYIW